jgi:molybdate transport system substrate-binding protein
MRIRIAAVVVLIATLCACTNNSTTTSTSTSIVATDASTASTTTSVETAVTSTSVDKKKSGTSTTVPVCANSADKGTLTVFSASSMVNVFNDVKAKYLASHPCTIDVIFSYGSSGTLAVQIVNGAPADIFVAASSATMTTVQNANLLKATPSTFAKNVAEIMMYPKSQFVGTIGTVQDLLDARSPGIKVGLCVASAPCGSLANTVLANARTAYSATNITRANIADSEAPSVEDLVMKIQLGEFDAGIVYHSDCRAAIPGSKAACVEIPESINSTNSYLVGQLNSKKNSNDFVAYLNSYDFQYYAQWKYGFLAP